MTANRKLSDLKIPQITIQTKSGSRWISTSGPFRADLYYRLLIVFGHPISVRWDKERYRKDNVELKIKGRGFKQGNRFVHSDKIVFYKDARYRSPVRSPTNQILFTWPQIKTITTAKVLVAYLRFKSGVPGRFRYRHLKWRSDLWGSVRDLVERNHRTRN